MVMGDGVVVVVAVAADIARPAESLTNVVVAEAIFSKSLGCFVNDVFVLLALVVSIVKDGVNTG